MNILTPKMDGRIETVYFTRDSLVVDLKDGRTISVPITWFPKLLKASQKQRSNWEICGGGYGIHWPDIDEDLSSEGLLRGAPAPRSNKARNSKKPRQPKTNRSIRRPRLKSKLKTN